MAADGREGEGCSALPFARCAQVLRERGAISVLDALGVPTLNDDQLAELIFLTATTA